jgi:flavin-dependent dehydrogenase
MTNRPVVIVGGGVAGLSCARQLLRDGVDTLLLEAQDDVGGRVCWPTSATAAAELLVVHGSPPRRIHQPCVPGSPLKGPTMSLVIQPP